MQILQRTLGSIQQYLRDIKESAAADRCRPERCPLCRARACFLAHGFYYRTLVHVQFDESIPVRRYLCRLCRRTVSRLPDFVLPYLRHSIIIIGLFLVSRLLATRSLREAAQAAFQPGMPYQRGQFWVRRFRKQAAGLCAALASLTAAVTAPDFVTRALQMLEATGWIAAHCFLFGELRMHLLGWPRFLIPSGGPISFPSSVRSS
jgi:transposase-like protein